MDTSSSSANWGANKDFKDTSFVPEKGFYQPRTEDTKEAYEALISFIESLLGTIPRVVMCSVAEEVLSVLKSKVINNPIDQKKEIEKLLNPIPDFVFDELVSISEVINDFNGRKDDRVLSCVSEEDFYQPKTEDTYTSYKLLLDVVAQELPREPQMVQCVVAHEVLAILNDETVENLGTKKVMIGYLMEEISDETFDLLVFIAAGLAVDFKGSDEDALDQDADVAKCDDQSLIRRSGEKMVEEEEVEDCLEWGHMIVDLSSGDGVKDSDEDPTAVIEDFDLNSIQQSEQQVQEVGSSQMSVDVDDGVKEETEDLTADIDISRIRFESSEEEEMDYDQVHVDDTDWVEVDYQDLVE